MVHWCRVLVLPSQESISTSSSAGTALELAVSRHTCDPASRKPRLASGKWWPAPECQPNYFSARMKVLHSLASSHLLAAWTRLCGAGIRSVDTTTPGTKTWYMLYSVFTPCTCIQNSANCVWSDHYSWRGSAGYSFKWRLTKISQSQRRPLLGPSPGALSLLRHYEDTMTLC